MRNEQLHPSVIQAPADYTSFSVVRRVERDTACLRFLQRVGEIACNVLPPHDENYLPPNMLVPDDLTRELEKDEYPPILLQMAVSGSRLKLYDRLELSLFNREVPREMEYGSSYMQAARQLRQQNRQIALAAQQFEGMLDGGEPHELSFTALTWYVEPHKRYNDLALVPNPVSPVVALWMSQVSACFDVMRQTSSKRSSRAIKRTGRTVFPTDGVTPVVRFARLPEDADEDERIRLVELVQGLLPVQLKLGAISINFEQKEQL